MPESSAKRENTPKVSDGRSSYSRISRVSRYTQNILNKSNNQVNEQWYQYLFNNDQLVGDDASESAYSNAISHGAQSRFTLNSKLSNATKRSISQISRM